MRVWVYCAHVLSEFKSASDSEQIEICDERAFKSVYFVFVSSFIILQLFESKLCRCKFQNCITVSFKCFIALLTCLYSLRRSSPENQFRVHIVANLSNELVAMQHSFNKGKYNWQLRPTLPLGSTQVVRVHVERTEDWLALRSSQVILFSMILFVGDPF